MHSGPINLDGLATLWTRMAQKDNCNAMQTKLVINHLRLALLLNKKVMCNSLGLVDSLVGQVKFIEKHFEGN